MRPFPDEHISITTVSFEGDNIIEADLRMEATQTGEIFGIPATGRRIRFDVHERCRFVDGKLAERWAQVDLEAIKRQLTGPTQQSPVSAQIARPIPSQAAPN